MKESISTEPETQMPGSASAAAIRLPGRPPTKGKLHEVEPTKKDWTTNQYLCAQCNFN